MTTRVSTGSNYSVMTSNLMRAQIRQNTIGEQVSSQKIANDLKGYAKNAEVLTGMRSAQAKIDGLLDQTKLTSNRLDMQDTGIGQLSDAAQSAREAIENALASDTAQTLMQQLQAAFGNAVQGLNTKSNGKYVFAGAQTDTPPTSARSMADLTAAAATSDLFHNDQYIQSNRIDEQTSVPTGVLADDLGTDVFEAFKQIQTYVDANGPFTGNLTEAQKTFLTGVKTAFADSRSATVIAQGQNGINQKRFESAQADLQEQADTLTGMVGGIVDVDMAEAVTRLQAAQLAVQASAQVFSTLQASSLLNVLK
jgi:flagellar hook-associated protein 3 FlgL